MNDIIERAEAALADPEMDLVRAAPRKLIADLVAELEVTRAKIIDRDEALTDVRAALKAARAENERLRSTWTPQDTEKYVDGVFLEHIDESVRHLYEEEAY